MKLITVYNSVFGHILLCQYFTYNYMRALSHIRNAFILVGWLVCSWRELKRQRADKRACGKEPDPTANAMIEQPINSNGLYFGERTLCAFMNWSVVLRHCICGSQITSSHFVFVCFSSLKNQVLLQLAVLHCTSISPSQFTNCKKVTILNDSLPPPSQYVVFFFFFLHNMYNGWVHQLQPHPQCSQITWSEATHKTIILYSRSSRNVI